MLRKNALIVITYELNFSFKLQYLRVSRRKKPGDFLMNLSPVSVKTLKTLKYVSKILLNNDIIDLYLLLLFTILLYLPCFSIFFEKLIRESCISTTIRCSSGKP